MLVTNKRDDIVANDGFADKHTFYIIFILSAWGSGIAYGSLEFVIYPVLGDVG